MLTDGTSDSGNTQGPAKAVLVVVPLLIVIAVLAVIGVAWWYLKKKKPNQRFYKLELHEDEANEEVHSPVELKSNDKEDESTNVPL